MQANLLYYQLLLCWQVAIYDKLAAFIDHQCSKWQSFKHLKHSGELIAGIFRSTLILTTNTVISPALSHCRVIESKRAQDKELITVHWNILMWEARGTIPFFSIPVLFNTAIKNRWGRQNTKKKKKGERKGRLQVANIITTDATQTLLLRSMF